VSCPRTDQFLVPPIISGMGKATNSNFVRTFIGSIGRVRAQGLSKNSAAGIKLRTSNLVGTFISDIREKKPIKIFGDKGA